MTPSEFGYIKRAVEALESGECTAMAQRRILRTMEQICGKSATEIEQNVIGDIDAVIHRKYQDLQNKKLVDILKQ